jgi:hypothetical protein
VLLDQQLAQQAHQPQQYQHQLLALQVLTWHQLPGG